MTNAEKFLKDGVDIKELCNGFSKFVNENGWTGQTDCTLIDYLKQPCKPTLTEDERVILRNLEPKMWNTILREDNGDIAFGYKLSKRYRSLGRCEFYNHLFQFIKERRRISDRRIIRR